MTLSSDIKSHAHNRAGCPTGSHGKASLTFRSKAKAGHSARQLSGSFSTGIIPNDILRALCVTLRPVNTS